MIKKIILVEDDPFLSEIYVTKFEEAGMEVSVVTDGSLAVSKIKEEKPDAVLLDIVMPKLDGFGVLKAIKEDPEIENIAVIILSNLGELENVERGLKMGASAYLVKAHYTPTEVVAKVKEILDKEK